MEIVAKNQEAIISYLNSLDDSDLVQIHNQRCQCDGYSSDEIHYNDEEFFNVYFGNDVMGALRASQYGEYNYTDEYVKFNGYANLETTNSPTKWVDFSELADAILKSPDNFDCYIELEVMDVVIEDYEEDEETTKYSIVDESGCTIETDFDSFEDAEEWAVDNNYNVVDSFNV